MSDSKSEGEAGWEVAAFLIWLGSVPLWAWAGSVLWRWFMVPIGLPSIGMWHVCGIAMTVRFIAWAGPEQSQLLFANRPEPRERIALELLTPVLALAFGWAIKSFM